MQRYASPKMNLRAQEQPRTAGDGGKLRWQSWLVLAAAAPWCAIGTLRYATTSWTGATQTALLISLALAFLVWLARAATPPAAVTGGLFTAVLTLGPQPGGPFHSGLPSLLTLFVLTWGATRFGRSKKQQLGVAEDQHGRNAAQVAANLGVAGLGATAAPIFSRSLFALVVVAALAEATADTLASELGEVLGGRPLMVTSLRRVSAGTDGAISLVGTLAGTSGAVLVVLVAALTLRLTVPQAVCAALGAIAGLFVDSLLGATAERRGWLNNDAVNFLSTLAAALIAILLVALW
jgi:uncharacterized protein (TIGR00297 family)